MTFHSTVCRIVPVANNTILTSRLTEGMFPWSMLYLEQSALLFFVSFYENENNFT